MPAGRPLGSKTQVSTKPFRDALKQVLADAENCPQHEKRRLRRIAERLLDLCAGGDLQAILSLADRLDGKPVQGHGQDTDLGPLTVRWMTATEATEPVLSPSQPELEPNDTERIADTKH